MGEANNILTVMKMRTLSDQVRVTVTLTFGDSSPRVDWRAPRSRSPADTGLSVLTDEEAHQYGIVLGETYREFTRICKNTLMHVTDQRCGPGMLEGGAAIAVFVGKGGTE